MSAGNSQRDSALATLRIGEIHQLVAGKVGVDGDEMEGVGAFLGRRGRGPDWFGIEHAIANHAQAAVSLRDENGARIGERQTPRMEEPCRDWDHANLAALHVEYLGACNGPRRFLRADWDRKQE